MRNDLSALDTALELLRRGFWPIPLWPLGAEIREKKGKKIATGKEPLGGGWGKKRHTVASIQTMFRNHPGAGVGLLLGPEGGVIDIEGDGPGWEESRARLMGGEMPETMGWSSRRSPHGLFQWDDRLASLGKTTIKLPDLPGLEIRTGQFGSQTQSACPPTLGIDGTPRRWNGCDTIAKLPETAIHYLLERAMTRSKDSPIVRRATTNGAATDHASVWFRQILASAAGKVAMASDGNRNDALNKAAYTLGGYVHHGYLTEAEIEAELTVAARLRRP